MLSHSEDGYALLQFKSSFTTLSYTNYPCEEQPQKTSTWKNGTNCCSWQGVTCDTVSGHVIGLNLGCESLRGDMTYYYSVTMTVKGNNIVMVKIPIAFGIIDLSQNKFDGEIPNVIGDLQALKGLNLSHNRLTGPIPRSIGNLSNMESLDLSSNKLTGAIPVELTNLNGLEVLNLSSNHLIGEIPQGKQFNTFLNDSYEGNIGLCGLPLSKKCRTEQYPTPSPNFWSEEKFGFGWKPVAIGYGCGTVIGIGLGCCMFLIGKPRWLVMMFGGQPKQKVTRKTRVRRRTHG
ncbi:hypothetical protein TSUD_256820 [Trifolium subterraneum]|uniref:Leucine-rich repeat-containing N-terminal plant-type domain-containing protein n=1 Tax=Trifolium subterraneum TaxID=3900 RepID=A0A2Z6M7C7_TRISU|nr:hypothetical protein TSUD_256820 [Trifolium subterraneum]